MPAFSSASAMPPRSASSSIINHPHLFHQQQPYQQQQQQIQQQQQQQSSSQPRNYSLRRLARYRLTSHLASYKKQKQQKTDARKASDESDSLFSFPSTSTSAQNERVIVPLENAFNQAQTSLRLELARRNLKNIPEHLLSEYDISDTLLLDLSGNSLNDLPTFLSALTHLQTLIARTNCIGPHLTIGLHSLTYLDLSGNRISTLSDSFFKNSRQLKILLLAGNRLESINAKISFLADSLEELNISSNLLTVLPKELCSLKNLCVFNVRNNYLNQLPAELGALKRLSLFDASRNRLTHLPSSLWQITGTTRTILSFNVDENPLVSPPLSVVRRGRMHIGKYLRKLIADDAISYENMYDTEFNRSHGIYGDVKNVAHKKYSDSVSTKDRSSSWSVPLTVNTAAANHHISTTPNGKPIIGGTDSGYASTVDEHRFSHEFAYVLPNTSSNECIARQRYSASSKDQTSQENLSTNGVVNIQAKASPFIPRLNLEEVAKLSEHSLNAPRNKETKILGTKSKSIDANNNNNTNMEKSIYDNTGNEIIKSERIIFNENEGFNNHNNHKNNNNRQPGGKIIYIRYNNLHINEDNSSPMMENRLTRNNAGLLNGLHINSGGLNPTQTQVLSPLVERNESITWNGVTSDVEIPPANTTAIRIQQEKQNRQENFDSTTEKMNVEKREKSHSNNHRQSNNVKIHNEHKIPFINDRNAINENEVDVKTSVFSCNNNGEIIDVVACKMEHEPFLKPKSRPLKPAECASSTLPRIKIVTKSNDMQSASIPSTSVSNENIAKISKIAIANAPPKVTVKSNSKLLKTSATRIIDMEVKRETNVNVTRANMIANKSSVSIGPIVKGALVAKCTDNAMSSSQHSPKTNRSIKTASIAKPLEKSTISQRPNVSSLSKMSRSTVVPTTNGVGASNSTIKRPPSALKTTAPVVNRMVRGSSTAPQQNFDKALTQKATSTMNLAARKAANNLHPARQICGITPRVGSVVANKK